MLDNVLNLELKVICVSSATGALMCFPLQKKGLFASETFHMTDYNFIKPENTTKSQTVDRTNGRTDSK